MSLLNKEIKINITDFYDGFDKKDNYIYKILSEKYIVTIDERNPDYLFYSCWGQEFLNYNCIKIYYTSENVIPDFNFCDYATGFAYLDFNGRYKRFANFVAYEDQVKNLFEKKDFLESDLKLKTGFCNYIYSNGKADPVRDNFFYLLSKYKKVISAGKHLNNFTMPLTDPVWSVNKVNFMRSFKFSIAFENSSLPGYTTEKLMHAFISNTIPIYWGDPTIGENFNSKAFINLHDFTSAEEAIDKIIELDQNDKLYIEMMNQKVFNRVPDYLQKDFLLNFYDAIFDQPLEKAKRRTSYGYLGTYEQRTIRQLKELENFKRSFKSDLKKFLTKYLLRS